MARLVEVGIKAWGPYDPHDEGAAAAQREVNRRELSEALTAMLAEPADESGLPPLMLNTDWEQVFTLMAGLGKAWRFVGRQT
jgi:hypothetical protein